MRAKQIEDRMHYTLVSSGRKWLSFFHIIGQAKLACEEAEAVLATSSRFEQKTDRAGLLWLKVKEQTS